MKLKPFKRAPAIIAVAALVFVCGVRLLRPDFFERLECMTYDLRARTALRFPAPVATNLAFISIEESSFDAVKSGAFGYRYGLYWPRQVYGRLVEELSTQDAKAVAFDILFGELRPDHPAVQMADGRLMESDEFFAAQARHASNVIIAATPEIKPPNLFATNVLALGDISADRDSDGILRRVRARTDKGVWDLGIVLAAQELKLDLNHAAVDLAHGRITLQGPKGMERVIPVDADGCFYIDWRLKLNDPRLLCAPIESFLWQDVKRLLGMTNGLSNSFYNKLVIVGTVAQGNNFADRGATPLEEDTFLVSKHWNVASSIITNRFIRRTSLTTELVLIALLGGLTAFLTWQLRAIKASLAVLLLAAVYVTAGFFLFVQYRCWLPMVFPVAGAILVEHICLVTHRVVFEERERRHIKAVFSRVVSPEVADELLSAEKLSLGGARRELTVLFTDVRGFAAWMDGVDERAAEYVREHQLETEAAEEFFNESAREMLNTMNLYLAVVNDAVKKHGGTLDKYIGDCVMAFWGAPVPNEKHALACVQAAIDAHRAVYELNQRQTSENKNIEKENNARIAAGRPPKPLHTALMFGTGINTGVMTVGMMGSDTDILNYTVFGREVNLASRLESVAGRGHIIISDTTYNHLLRSAPELAATCVEMFPVTVKGMHAAVRIYELPWQQPQPA